MHKHIIDIRRLEKDNGAEVIVASELGSGERTLLKMSGIRAVRVDPGTKVKDALDEALKQLLMTAP